MLRRRDNDPFQEGADGIETLVRGLARPWPASDVRWSCRFDVRYVCVRHSGWSRAAAPVSAAELDAKLDPSAKPFEQCLAAMGLSWRKRLERPIAVPSLDFGAAQLLLLPGESYVEFQLAAQRVRPESFVCVAGYGDGATGYIPTDRHFVENDTNLSDWCWVAPGSEARLLEAIRPALERVAR